MVWICAQKAKYCKWEVAVQEEQRKTSDEICGCSEGGHAEAWCDAEDC